MLNWCVKGALEHTIVTMYNMHIISSSVTYISLLTIYRAQMFL